MLIFADRLWICSVAARRHRMFGCFRPEVGLERRRCRRFWRGRTSRSRCASTLRLGARGVLVRDSNKLVSSAVISGPKLNESEVEAYAA
jgi:hypothetical protein